MFQICDCLRSHLNERFKLLVSCVGKISLFCCKLARRYVQNENHFIGIKKESDPALYAKTSISHMKINILHLSFSLISLWYSVFEVFYSFRNVSFGCSTLHEILSLCVVESAWNGRFVIGILKNFHSICVLALGSSGSSIMSIEDFLLKL